VTRGSFEPDKAKSLEWLGKAAAACHDGTLRLLKSISGAEALDMERRGSLRSPRDSAGPTAGGRLCPKTRWLFALYLRILPLAVAACALSAVGGAAHARVVHEELRVPVKVVNGTGAAVAHDIVVTLFYETTAPRPYPLLVINHGRAASASERAALGRAKYSDASWWFAGLGFMVAVPTRVGYGVTGGEDVEDTGPCSRKKYEPGYAASAEQTIRVIAAMRVREEVTKDRTAVVGQSFGGTTSITVAAKNLPGVQAARKVDGGLHARGILRRDGDRSGSAVRL